MNIHITFIGNCQTLSLCFFCQQLLAKKHYDVRWVSFGKHFEPNLGRWSDKCVNKIIEYSASIERVKISDIIIYQEIAKDKSLFSNTETLVGLKKSTCRLIKMPSIYLEYNNYNISIKELELREKINKTDLIVSNIFNKYKGYNLMLTVRHPNTFLFLEIVKELCRLLQLNFFTRERYNLFLKNPNYMELSTVEITDDKLKSITQRHETILIELEQMQKIELQNTTGDCNTNAIEERNNTFFRQLNFVKELQVQEILNKIETKS